MVIKWILLCLAAIFALLSVIAVIYKPKSVFKNEPWQQCPIEGKKVVFVFDDTEDENADGVRGHLEAVGESTHRKSFYEKYIKRAIDIILSFFGLVILSPLMLGIIIAIKLEDKGPAMFSQKRVGENKRYFKLHKFRSMKMSTPHDVPTHMLDNPEQYITKVGRFIRAHSLDELPQIWDVFVGNMSVIGPRPALWNQDLLTGERDEYGANDIKPGLTGWAQINGRDVISLETKSAFDGEYAAKMGFLFDIKLFLGSLGVFWKDEDIAESETVEAGDTEH